MKKFILSALVSACILSGINNSVMAENKIAVIDVHAVVQSSKQLQALNKEQQTKLQDLEKWVKICQADINKQQTQAGKEKLAKKYDSELNSKKEAISKNYKEKLSVIDKNINDTIAAQAKANGYNMVISKEVVLFGGNDITSAVISAIK